MREEGRENLEGCARVFVSLFSDRRRRRARYWRDRAAAPAAVAGAGEEDPAGTEVPELAVGHVLPSHWAVGIAHSSLSKSLLNLSSYKSLVLVCRDYGKQDCGKQVYLGLMTGLPLSQMEPHESRFTDLFLPISPVDVVRRSMATNSTPPSLVAGRYEAGSSGEGSLAVESSLAESSDWEYHSDKNMTELDDADENVNQCSHDNENVR
ncbi:hypothetical protein J5N97_009818 [Dioscorea zingiberensis]|uniref:Uncharacterized protein n=1 Tax=Dioscorea zingiberensis TaxID=325984 RepID=A0A9D5D034_9LILI|nr:hypothetical protein J5N97_009818 [Dioscorea zingiberensis]